MARHNKDYSGVVVSAVVFDGEGRVLLIQRAAHDSMPNLWEVPGGGADQEDGDSDDEGEGGSKGTLLRATARELWEEAGLIATRFTHVVPQPAEAPPKGSTEAPRAACAGHPGSTFTNRRGTGVYVRFTFHVQAQSCDVVLDPEEHQAYVWATEDEVRRGVMADGRAIPATVAATRAVILEAFRLRGNGQ